MTAVADNLNLLFFCIEWLSENRVFQAVLKYGVAQWSSIGLAMGLSYSEIGACTDNKPAPSSKLEAIIAQQVHKCGIKQTEQCLLSACEKIPQPIIGAVKEYIRSGRSGLSHCWDGEHG